MAHAARRLLLTEAGAQIVQLRRLPAPATTTKQPARTIANKSVTCIYACVAQPGPVDVPSAAFPWSAGS